MGFIAFRRCLYRVFSVSHLVAKSMESWNRFLSFFSVWCFLFSRKINGVLESVILIRIRRLVNGLHCVPPLGIQKIVEGILFRFRSLILWVLCISKSRVYILESLPEVAESWGGHKSLYGIRYSSFSFILFVAVSDATGFKLCEIVASVLIPKSPFW